MYTAFIVSAFALCTLSALSPRLSIQKLQLTPLYSVRAFHSLLTLFTLAPVSPAFATVTKNTRGYTPSVRELLMFYFNCAALARLTLTPVLSSFLDMCSKHSEFYDGL